MNLFGIGAQARENARQKEIHTQSPDQFGEMMQKVTEALTEIGNIRKDVTALQTARENMNPLPAPDQLAEEQNIPPTMERPRLADMSVEEIGEMDPRAMLAMHSEEIKEDLLGAVKEVIAPLARQVNEVNTSFQRSQGESEISTVMKERGEDGKLVRPDFDEWRPEMQAILRKHPTMSIAEAYDNARLYNPEKLAEIEKKYFASPEVEEDKVTPLYGGMVPDLMRQTVDGGDLTLDDAASLSFRKMQEEHGEIPPVDAGVGF